MKIWLIYYTGNLDDISVEFEESDGNDRLYAITNDKKLYKEFMNTRNEKVFKVKKKDVLPSEYAELSTQFRGSVLSKETLETKGEDGYSKDSVDMVMTEHEYQIATDEDFIEYVLCSDEFWANSPEPIILKPKIMKALEVLQYIQFRKITVNTRLEQFDDYTAPDVTVDALHQFIVNFSGTLNL